jgi:hypothetical protein
MDSDDNIWRATIAGTTHSLGAMIDGTGVRSPFFQNVPCTIPTVENDPNSDCSAWTEDWFHGETGNTYVYLRNTVNPGTVEIGTRPYGIVGNTVDYITVDGITVYGPFGYDTATWTYTDVVNDVPLVKKRGPISFRNSNYIIIQNNTVKYGFSLGMGFWESGANTQILNNSIDEFWGGTIHNVTGSTHTIRGNHLTRMSVVSSDVPIGDRDGIGLYIVTDIIIEDNFVDYGGTWSLIGNANCISLADCNGMIIRRNYVTSCGKAGITLAANDTAGSYGVQVYNNVVDGWAAIPNADDKWYAGIQIGGSTPAADTYGNLYVYNNLLLNGADGNNNRTHGSINIRNDAYLIVKVANNVFHNNSGVDYELYADVNDFTTQTYNNNYFYRASGTGNIIFQAGGSNPYTYSQISTWESLVNGWGSGAAANNVGTTTNPAFATDTQNSYTIYTVDSSTVAAILTGGEVLSGGVSTAISSLRVWTPFSSADYLTRTRSGVFARGPFELVGEGAPSPFTIEGMSF